MAVLFFLQKIYALLVPVYQDLPSTGLKGNSTDSSHLPIFTQRCLVHFPPSSERETDYI